MSTAIITQNKTAISGIAGIALAAAIAASLFAATAPQIARDSAATAVPIISGQVSLAETVVESTQGGAFIGE